MLEAAMVAAKVIMGALLATFLISALTCGIVLLVWVFVLFVRLLYDEMVDLWRGLW